MHGFCVGWEKDDNGTRQDVALACFPRKFDNIQTFVYDYYGAALMLSSIFALITLIIYIMLPWLQDLQGKIIMALLLSVCIGYLSLSIVQLFTNHLSQFGCVLAGFMVYYWLFASFSWLHISSFNIWRTVALRHQQYSLFKNRKSLFIIYSIGGWGLPGIFLVISLILEFVIEGDEDRIRPAIGEMVCFINNYRDKWILFYGPVCFLIVINLYYFISVVYHLNKMNQIQENLNAQRAALESKQATPTIINNTLIKTTDKHKKRISSTTNKYNIYSKMFFAMGITFIFEILSAIFNNDTSFARFSILELLFFIMDLVNALQGVILFIVLILLRKRVLRGFFEKLNIPIQRIFPSLAKDEHNFDNEYSDMEDEESTDDDKKQITNNGVRQEQRVIEEIQMA